MAPTPINAFGRMVFSVVVNGLTHELHYYCNPIEDVSIPGGWGLENNHVGGSNIDGADAADGWWGIVRDMYANTVVDPVWSLEKYYSGVYVPVNAGVAAVGNGTGGTISVASVITTTFKDFTNRYVKFTFPESSFAIPYRSNLGADVTALGDFAASVLNSDGSAAHIGSWACGRSNNVILFSKTASGTVSKRLRRIRGLL